MPATRSSRKDSDRAITPAAKAVHLPAHLALPGSLQAKQLCNLLLDHIQISQEADQVVWCSHLFKNFPQFVVIHTSKGIHPKRGNMG